LGVDRRLREHHRGVLGGASRFPGVRVPASGGRRQAAGGDGALLLAGSTAEPIPLAKPDLTEREEELVLDVLRSGRLSLGPMLERFERAFAEWLGTDDAAAVS